jgi:hypothetical protein
MVRDYGDGTFSAIIESDAGRERDKYRRFGVSDIQISNGSAFFPVISKENDISRNGWIKLEHILTMHLPKNNSDIYIYAGVIDDDLEVGLGIQSVSMIPSETAFKQGEASSENRFMIEFALSYLKKQREETIKKIKNSRYRVEITDRAYLIREDSRGSNDPILSSKNNGLIKNLAAHLNEGNKPKIISDIAEICKEQPDTSVFEHIKYLI